MFHIATYALQHLPRVVSALIGLTFLYMALFMYHDEAGILQNRSVNLWVRVNEKHEAFLSKQALVMKVSAADLAPENWTT
jgi:uncharacterized membrane protein (Fun14 family)